MELLVARTAGKGTLLLLMAAKLLQVCKSGSVRDKNIESITIDARSMVLERVKVVVEMMSLMR